MENPELLKEDSLYVHAVEAAKNNFKRPLPYSKEKIATADRIEIPVAVLCGPMTCSAAENFLIYIDPLKNFFTVREPSNGSTGNPIDGILPGRGAYRICAIERTYLDRRKFINTGIKPTIEVRPTLDDMIAGKDVVLERAIEELKKHK